MDSGFRYYYLRIIEVNHGGTLWASREPSTLPHPKFVKAGYHGLVGREGQGLWQGGQGRQQGLGLGALEV